MLSSGKKRMAIFAGIYKNTGECLLIVFAGFVYACAIKYFIFPSKIIMTGTEGISIATAYFFDNHMIFIWLYLFFQSALIIFAFIKISFRFAFRTALVVGSVVSLLSLLPEHQFANPEPHNERIILVIFGGILAGMAKSIAFRYSASTGDEDIPSAYLSMKYLKPVGSIAAIAAVASTAFGMLLAYIKTQQIEPVINTLMYTTIYIFISTETLNNFYRKFKLSLITLITKSPEKIGKKLKEALPHRTYTIQEGLGGYSKNRVKILQAIVTQEEMPDIIRLIEETDKNTFFFHNEIEGVSKQYYISPIG